MAGLSACPPHSAKRGRRVIAAVGLQRCATSSGPRISWHCPEMACSPICRLTLGAGGDDATAAKYRATLAANMTPTQVAQALSLAAAWRPKHDWGALLK